MMSSVEIDPAGGLVVGIHNHVIRRRIAMADRLINSMLPVGDVLMQQTERDQRPSDAVEFLFGRGASDQLKPAQYKYREPVDTISPYLYPSAV